MRKYFSCLALASALVTGCVSNQPKEIQYSAYPAETTKASDIAWRASFGYRKEETNNVYIPVTQGLLLTPQSTNFVSLIESWLAKHTNAEAIVVYTTSPVTVDIPDSKLKSIWLVDGEECLNVYLVERGSCPAFTMLLNPGDKTPLTQKQYETFAKKIFKAEALAKRDKLGIWNESRH